MPGVTVLQHIGFEKLGSIADALSAAGITYRYVRTFEGQPVPGQMEDAAGLIVMGGPMGVNDHPWYPFLLDEMNLIELALKEGKPVLGICLGSQLLAATLGAAVSRSERKEIGWYPVTLKEGARTDRLLAQAAASFMAFHWHGDVFELPEAAAPLPSSQMTEHQAFRYGDGAYGFLFHPEITEPIIKLLVEECADELEDAGVEGDRILQEAGDYLPGVQEMAQEVWREWIGLLA